MIERVLLLRLSFAIHQRKIEELKLIQQMNRLGAHALRNAGLGKPIILSRMTMKE